MESEDEKREREDFIRRHNEKVRLADESRPEIEDTVERFVEYVAGDLGGMTRKKSVQDGFINTLTDLMNPTIDLSERWDRAVVKYGDGKEFITRDQILEYMQSECVQELIQKRVANFCQGMAITDAVVQERRWLCADQIWAIIWH